MSSTVGLSRGEKVDLALLVGGGVLLGAGAVLLRAFSPGLVPLGIYHFQYTMGVIFFGVVTLLQRKSNTKVGAFGFSILLFATGVALLLPPKAISTVQVVSNVLYLSAIFLGGILHYRFNEPTNTLLIALNLLVGLELYLYGVAFLLMAYLEAGSTLFLFAVAFVTVMLEGFRRLLGREFAEVDDDRTLAGLLDYVLPAGDS